LAAEQTGLRGLAGRYATALFELAEESKKLDEVAADLKMLQRATAESGDLQRMLRSPLYSREQKSQAMAAVLAKGGVNELTRRFVLLVASNHRLFALPEMIQAYLEELARRRGQVTAEVVAAEELSDAQQKLLIEMLRRSVGSNVKVDLKVDPGLIGGLIVKVGSRMVDSSLRTKLHRLQSAMKGAR
jgi:F-type H+-transporting ATPase subunit delta